MPPRSADLAFDIYGIRDIKAVRAATFAILEEAGFDLRDPRLLLSFVDNSLFTVDAITRHANPRIFTHEWTEEVRLRLFRADPSCGVKISVRPASYADERTPVAG